MLRILVVDDDADQRHLLEEALKPHHEVVCAQDGRAAFQMKPETFDLIISDLMMPGMSGLELKAALAANGIAVPMILVSSDGQVGTEAMKAGFFDFLLKPYSLDQLAASIAQVATEGSGIVTVPTVAPSPAGLTPSPEGTDDSEPEES